MKYKLQYLVIPFLIIGMTACVDLAHINTFAKASEISLDKASIINFSFEEYCRKYQEPPLSFSLTSINPADAHPTVDCAIFKNSDSVMKGLRTILTAFMIKLDKLSDEKLVNYNLEGLTNSFSSLQQQIGFTFTDAQVTSTKNILTFLLNKGVNIYRKSELKKVIIGLHEDLPNVLDAYATALQALDGEANLALQNYSTFYTKAAIVLTNDNVLKSLFVVDFKKKETEFASIKHNIAIYITCLKEIKDGFNDLTDAAQNSSITSSAIKSKLKSFVGDIQYLLKQFNNLKK